MRSSRARIAVLTVAVGALAAISGGTEAALFALPFAALAALLLSGRYVGEQRILALRRQAIPPRRRTASAPWRRARPSRASTLFAGAPRTFRGPPVSHCA